MRNSWNLCVNSADQCSIFHLVINRVFVQHENEEFGKQQVLIASIEEFCCAKKP